MYILHDNQSIEEIIPTTFSELKMTESQMEEIIAANLNLISDEEESMIIIGKQVKNSANGRSDLTAVDDKGNIVLIEIKRDKNDITNRKENFESQAIRYAASYATIKTVEEAVRIIYAPYLEKFAPHEVEPGSNYYENGLKTLNKFLGEQAANTFNQTQRIVLIASDFDAQTLSAAAWLSQRGIDISCYKMIPYKYNEQRFLKMDKLLPLATNEDYLVSLLEKSSPIKTPSGKRKQVLPKIKDMLEWGVVHPGDVLEAKDRDAPATLLANGNVIFNEEEMSMQSWLRKVYGWASVHTYVFAIHKEKEKSLAEIRAEYMEKAEEFADSET